jgi:hypothetical protein
MTTPALAHTTSQGHRSYTWAGRSYPSVTAVLAGGIPKPGLSRWAAGQAAAYAVANLSRLAALPADQAAAEIRRAPWQARNHAAGLGDLVHAQIEAHVTGQACPPVPDEHAEQVLALLDGFARFERDHRPDWLAAEQTVFSDTHGYAGTFDLLSRLDGQPGVALLDVKTGGRIYPEVAVQLAAYAHADFIGHPDGTTSILPAISSGLVLHLRPGGYELHPVPIDEEVFAAFLAALGVFRWASERAPGILPQPAAGGGGGR